LAAEPGVLVGELLVAVEGGGEPRAQRRFGGALAGRTAPAPPAAFPLCRSLRMWLLMSGWV
jgi:hypothetical protein